MARLLSLYEKEKNKHSNLVGAINVANLAIFEVGNHAMQKAKHIASLKPEAGRWSTLMAKARCDKEATEKKWKALQGQLHFCNFGTDFPFPLTIIISFLFMQLVLNNIILIKFFFIGLILVVLFPIK